MSHPLAVAITLLLIAATWGGIVLYSRHTFYLEGCAACGGSGKQWEPEWMAWCRFSRTRRFRPCPACGGNAKFNIHD